MPRKKSDSAKPELQNQRPTRELFRFVAFYNQKIKAHGPDVTATVLRNIQRLLDKGLGIEDMAIALENYENDEWRKANPRYSKDMRSFFTMETIKEWLTPRPKLVKPDPLKHVHAFETSAKPAPAKPMLFDDPEDESLEL